MWPTVRHTPIQLAVIAARGAVLYVALLLLATLVPFPHSLDVSTTYHPWLIVLVRILASLLVILPGMLLWVRSLSYLRRGVRQGRWTDEQIEELRAQLNRPFWNVVRWSITIGIAVSFLFLPQHTLITIGFFLLPLTGLTELRSSLAKPLVKERSTIDWTRVKPLHSDHWGAPRAG